jgi:predicted phosphodiesterase
MFYKDHVLAFGCTHLPFEHPLYLDFIMEIKSRVKCGTVVCLGDFVDNHALSMSYLPDPNGRSPADEINEAREHAKKYYKAIPNLYYCFGNHCKRVDNKARHVGLPDDVFRPFRDIWGLPKGWRDDYSWEINGVRYLHGTGISGDNAPEKAAINNRQSSVIAHIHHNLKAGFMASAKDRILYMGTGCGIDIKRYAFEYNRDFPKRPLLGCGVITDAGRFAQTFPMEI